MEIFLVGAYTLLFLSYFVYRKKPRYWGCDPSFWFVVAQGVIFFGTVYSFRANIQFTFDTESHLVHLACMLAGLGTFLAGHGLLYKRLKIRQQERFQGHGRSTLYVENWSAFNMLIYGAAFVSIVISFFYYLAVGYNLFLDTVMSVIRGQDLGDSVSLRLAAYSGERYFFPGYVNQFKNVLLPLCVIFVVTRYLIYRNRRDLFLSLLLVPISIIMILGTGQRGAFLTAVAIAVISMSMSISRRKKVVVVSIILPLLLAGYMINSYASGRIGADDSPPSVFSDIVQRIGMSNQVSGIAGFELVYKRYYPTQNEWTDELLNVLPGRSEKKLNNNAMLIFSMLYGSSRGTAPLSLWGSIFNSFGFPGIIVVPFLMGVIYCFLYHRFLRGRDSLFRRLLWTAAAFNLGTWIAGGPLHLFNSGVITIGLLSIAYSLMVPRRQAAGARRGHARTDIAVSALTSERDF